MSAAQDVIRRFMAVFGEPKTPDPDAFITEYEKALTGYEKRFLDAAADRLIKRSTFWPKPAEVLAEANAISSEFYGRNGTDWDAVERDRREGWKLADLGKAKIDDEAKARVREMVAEMKRNIKAITSNPDDEVDWESGSRDSFEARLHLSRNVKLHRRSA